MYETLINTSSDCILVVDENGLITFTTPQIKKLFGWESEEIIGRPVEILIPENVTEKHIALRQSYQKKPHPRPMGSSLNLYAKRKNNTEFPVDITLNFFKENDKTFYLAVIRDITSRKEVEERYKTLSNLTSDFAYSLSILPDGSFLREWVTDAFESVTGYSKNELNKEEVLSSIVLPDDKYILDSHIEKVLDKEKSTVEFRINKKDDSIIYVEDYRYPVINEETGKVTHIYGAVKDITEKKEKELVLIRAKEKAEESNQVKSKFFSNMSHELRTPLVGLLGFSEIIKDEAENEEIKEFGEMIYTSALRLQRTLNSVLEFSKINDKSFKLLLENVNVNSLAKEEFNLFKVDTEKKHIDYKINLKEDPFIIKSDKRLLTTIFNQIIDNAVKYTKKGFVEVDINNIKEGNNPFLLFEVRDTGIGIEKEKLNLIWEEFRQVSEGLARTYEGVGLGLSIVKKFVGLLNGSIEVKSKFEKGSSFCVKIPIKQIQIEMAKSDNNDKIEKLDKKRDNLILIIVEDDPINAITIRKYLEKTYRVEHAATPEEAIRMCKNKNYYLVLMDINLKSNMNGIELMKFLKENNYNYKNIPFIAQTAYVEDEEKMKFLESGFSDFISKPYTRKTLLEIVDKNLSLNVKS